MSLATPEKIRILQRKLYGKAKAQPAFRFYGLSDKTCRDDILHHAYGLARANAGAPGVDGMSFEQIGEHEVLWGSSGALTSALNVKLVAASRWLTPPLFHQ